MYFDDLSIYSYYTNEPLESVVTVGWIDSNNAYPQGEVDNNFLKKLKQIFTGSENFNAQVNKIRSIHPCNLCGSREEYINSNGNKLYLGASEIWIECFGKIYAAPSMIIHYVEEHKYLPPEEFIEAVLKVDLSVPFSGQNVYDKLVGIL